MVGPRPNSACMALHGDDEWSNNQLRQAGGLALFGMDDGYFVGPIDPAMKVLDEFQEWLKANVEDVL